MAIPGSGCASHINDGMHVCAPGGWHHLNTMLFLLLLTSLLFTLFPHGSAGKMRPENRFASLPMLLLKIGSPNKLPHSDYRRAVISPRRRFPQTFGIIGFPHCSERLNAHATFWFLQVYAHAVSIIIAHRLAGHSSSLLPPSPYCPFAPFGLVRCLGSGSRA